MTTCPRCGPVGNMVAHLKQKHGYTFSRAKAIYSKLVQKERLSVADSERLGIKLPHVKDKDALSQDRLAKAKVDGLPTDEELNLTLRRAGFEVLE